jgi:nucleotide-binding universal stress UspA family protein
MEGDPDTAATMRNTIRLARDVDLEIVVLHVRDAASLPMFEDQPQHETDAWAQEFLARYVSVPAAAVRLELRVGMPHEQIPAAAAELEADLVALGWLQDSSPGHAKVVRAALERCPTPVLLVPLVGRLARV